MSVVRIRDGLFRTIGSQKGHLLRNPISISIEPEHRWAVIGPRKTQLLEILASKHISDPPLARTYPFLHASKWPSQVTELIEFSNTPVRAPHLSARYESLREDLDQSLNDSLMSVVGVGPDSQSKIDHVLEILALKGIESRWIVGLSNGQSRRARLARALLRSPRLLLVDEPFVGLDPSSRTIVSQILSSLPPKPHIIVGLRYQDPLPEWITHVAITDSAGISEQGTVEQVSSMLDQMRHEHSVSQARAKQTASFPPVSSSSEPAIHLNGVSVSYRGEPIFTDLTWTVQQGEKWHLRGDNGTGKSTLLALLTADHPQSWNSKVSLFGEARETGKQSYFSINEPIGHVSPEIHALFPRNLTIREALATGYVVGSFIPPKKLSAEQSTKIATLISDFDLDPSAVFGGLPISDQKLVMFLRGILKLPKLLILDEAFSAMSEDLIGRCKALVEQFPGTVIAVGHLEDEVPRCDKFIRLTRGQPEIGTV